LNYIIETKRKAYISEVIQQNITANTLEEALDQAYELASLEPSITTDRWLIVEREYDDISMIDSSLIQVETNSA